MQPTNNPPLKVRTFRDMHIMASQDALCLDLDMFLLLTPTGVTPAANHL